MHRCLARDQRAADSIVDNNASITPGSTEIARCELRRLKTIDAKT
jgi:hypothetical protein